MLPNLLPTNGFNKLVSGRHGVILCNENDTVVGQSALHYGEYFESEVNVFRTLIRPGAHVADLGANIGMHTLALARVVGPAGWVYAFEPQRVVFQTLCANIALNSLTNVDCENLAVTAASGLIPIEELDHTAPGNFGGLELGTSATRRTVRGVTLDEYLAGRHLDFMKIDIQGMEEDCLIGARETLKRCKTTIYMENDQPEKSPSLIALLHQLGYSAYWHMPIFFNPANFAGSTENIHNFGYIDSNGPYLSCIGFAINMICVDNTTGAEIAGLMKVTDVLEHPLKRDSHRFHPPRS